MFYTFTVSTWHHVYVGKPTTNCIFLEEFLPTHASIGLALGILVETDGRENTRRVQNTLRSCNIMSPNAFHVQD